MHRPSRVWLTSILLTIAWSAGAAVDFGSEVLPVLQRACFECHGEEQAKGGLRLHDAKNLGLGGKNGPVVSPGKPTQSEMLRRITLPRSDKHSMPRRGQPLTPGEIATLQKWIETGAVWPETVSQAKHWSYIPPIRPPLPNGSRNGWARNEIDAFILERLAQKSLPPSREAEPAVLYRRLSLDLTGLPPSVEQVTEFVRSYTTASTPEAAESVLKEAVDGMLASPDFGVRWARPWLDLARYADSHGFQRDDLREIWAYRDWVVDALNADMPFDQFTIEQIAGDLLPNAAPSQVIATGFHRCTPTNVEAGTEPEETRINQVIDRVNTTGAVWLGSTLECAQCHDHKYDAFTQRDYYGILAFFNNTRSEVARAKPTVPGSIKFNGVPFPISTPDQEAELARLKKELKSLETRIVATPAPPKRPAKAQSTIPASLTPVRPIAMSSEGGATYQILPDKSVLFTGAVPERDTCTLEAEVTEGLISGVLIEALADPSLPGEGPGRGDAARPNFVLQQLQATLNTPDTAQPQRLEFSDAYASFSQSNYPVAGLLEDDPATGWAINPAFHRSHWAALALPKPIQVRAGSKLHVKLVQGYGGGRVIGRLRVSLIRGDVLAALPDTPQPPKTSSNPRLARVSKQKKQLEERIKGLTNLTSEVMQEMPKPRASYIFKRGVYTDPADPVTAAVPAFLPAPAAGPANRLTLARWLVDRQNPLTARVTVNRWWAELFGRGLVATVEDFGIKGTPPSHPELLDWLAVELMDSRWSMKAMLKKIVLSATYRQSSSRYAPAEAIPGTLHPGASADPENHLLWRGARHRMDAEMIRDNALAIAGLLNPKQGGPPIRPPQPDGLWTKVGGQKYDYVVSPGAEQYRRGLYVVLKRGAPYPSFVNFDASARMACVVKRSRSNTPLQALTLLNDPVYVETAKAFARRISTESESNKPADQIAFAVRLALARNPQPQELAILQRLYQEQLDIAQKDPATAARLAHGIDSLTPATSAEFAAWFAVATAILNLDETITKG